MTFPSARDREAYRQMLDDLQARHPGELVILFDGTREDHEGPRAERTDADDEVSERPTQADLEALEEAISKGDAIDAGLVPDPLADLNTGDA